MNIIAIIGKTSTGKDTLSRKLQQEFGFEPIVSYTTRPIRDTEVNGREHYFVTKEEFDKIYADKENIMAYVKFPKTNYEYCASTQGLNPDGTYTYIIDPVGLDYLKEHRPDIFIVPLVLDCSVEVIKQHALGRGDDIEKVEMRIQSEFEIFEKFIHNNKDQLLVIDAGVSIQYTFDKAVEYLRAKKVIN